jgi:hypothetical protein
VADLQASRLTRQMRPVPQQLLDFMAWYFEGGIKLKPPQDGLYFQGTPGSDAPGTRVASIVLYRDWPFQVEMIVFTPGVQIQPHLHDDVDSCEVALSGGVELFVEGMQVAFLREPRPDGLSRDFLKWAPIPHDARHGGRAGPQGGVFLSVQMWRSKAPTHVGKEWQEP